MKINIWIAESDLERTSKLLSRGFALDEDPIPYNHNGSPVRMYGDALQISITYDEFQILEDLCS